MKNFECLRSRIIFTQVKMNLQEKRWKVKELSNQEATDKLAEELNISQLLARLLMLRGVETAAEAKRFFRPEITDLHDPFLMSGMHTAVDRIKKAIAYKEKILIYGDYDVDGTTAVALLYSYLKHFTSALDYYIPDRYSEGYGVSFQGIDFAKANGFGLIIALDCGIKSVDKVDYALERGIDFIICDHHLPGETLPNAIAILNPKLPHSNYPYLELSGCGVGFKLVQALNLEFAGDKEWVTNQLDLVAISIAADIVPITGENRVLTFFGLQELNKRKRRGIEAILELAGLRKQITVSDIVFMISPRINAAGRITSGKKAVELLISENPDLAFAQGEEINETNIKRQSLDKNITEHALKMLSEDVEGRKRKTTVVYHPEWHKGVVGIVASRLTERYYRPTIVLTLSNGMVTGSARSVKDFDIYEAISKCSHLLDQFGGHKYAAGLSLKPENLSLFREEFDRVVSQNITEELLTPEIEIDAEVNLLELDDKFNRILKQFAPFGPGNLTPILKAGSLRDKGNARLVGSKHLKMDLLDNYSGKMLPAIAFNQGHHLAAVAGKKLLEVCFAIEENEFQGNISLQMNVKDIRVI
jgi:single-stranded-DNA-specific exonuclease